MHIYGAGANFASFDKSWNGEFHAYLRCRRSCCFICETAEKPISCVFTVPARMVFFAMWDGSARLLRMYGVCGLFVIAGKPRKSRFGRPRRDLWKPRSSKFMRIYGVLAMIPPRSCSRLGRFYAYIRHSGTMLCPLRGTRL